MEKALPFAILGFDSDNGGEFINHTLLRYWRQRDQPVKVTRSRPFRKNDNAHVEQKNRTKIREFLGHGRIDSPEAIKLYDEALRLHSLMDNLFLPSMKLQGKKQTPGGRWRKIYEKEALTPCQRLLASGHLIADQRRQLERLLEQSDPLSLKAQVEQTLAAAHRAQQQWEKAATHTQPKRKFEKVDNLEILKFSPPAAAQQQGAAQSCRSGPRNSSAVPST